jgi:hypothetical protein
MKRSSCIVFLALLLTQLGTPIISAQETQSSAELNKQLPDSVIYEFYFGRMASFEDTAQKNENKGLSGGPLRAVITKELGIGQDQRSILEQIAGQSLAKAASLDQRAAEIIQQCRSRYPKGNISRKDQVPSIPPELEQLQAARDSIFLNAKSQLSQLLNAGKFAEIDSRIKVIIVPKVSIKKP